MSQLSAKDSATKPWMRRENETVQAYEAFEAYREDGLRRALRRAAKKTGKHLTQICRWSSRHDWAERVLAWDAEVARVARDAELRAEAKQGQKWAERRLALRDTQFEVSEKLMAKCEAMLAFPISTQKVAKDGKEITINPTKWTFGDMSAMVRDAMKLRALAVGEATERVDHSGRTQVEVVAETNMTDEQVIAIIETYKRGNADEKSAA